MNAFAKRFTQLCKEKNVTLRQISERTGKTIKYLSDVKFGRRIPPADDTVKIMEDMFDIKNGSLSRLAKFVREAPKEFSQLMKSKPAVENFALTLLRAEDELTEDELQRKLAKAQKAFEEDE